MARGWATQERARGEIERLTGWRIPQSVYAEWESGRRTPTEGNLERLREFYGHEETGPATMGEADVVAAVVEAIDRQTEAIVKAIQGRDNILQGLLSELGKYRSSQLDVLRSLQETGPRAEPMPEDEPAPDPPGVAPTGSGRR